jgi:hypothetical protein
VDSTVTVIDENLIEIYDILVLMNSILEMFRFLFTKNALPPNGLPCFGGNNMSALCEIS